MYKKGRKLSRRMKVHGMDISIETDKGEYRHWYDPHNKEEGSTKMQYPYGYIRLTEGDDGEHVDVYVGPNLDSERVFIVRQLKTPEFKKYDEEKVMLGFESEKEAKQAYLCHYNTPKFFSSMREEHIDKFKNKYLNKSVEEMNQDPMGLQLDSYDINNIQSVQSQLNTIGGMNDKDLMKLSQAVWGDGYKYRPVSKNHIRAELRGFLQDQIEWLKMNPVASMTAEMGYVEMPTEMPHSSESSHISGTGQTDSGDLLNEQSLDGVVSPEETNNY